jgi:hypothetical protein
VDKGTGAQRQPLDAVEWLNRFEPAGVDPGRWDEVRRFVWDCVCRLGDRESSSAWRVLLSATLAGDVTGLLRR